MGLGLITCHPRGIFVAFVFPVSISRSDLIAEQRADPSLKELFQQVRPESEVLSSTSGYFLQDLLLVRKWRKHSESSMGECPIELKLYQIVLPAKLNQF